MFFIVGNLRADIFVENQLGLLAEHGVQNPSTTSLWPGWSILSLHTAAGTRDRSGPVFLLGAAQIRQTDHVHAIPLNRLRSDGTGSADHRHLSAVIPPGRHVNLIRLLRLDDTTPPVSGPAQKLPARPGCQPLIRRSHSRDARFFPRGGQPLWTAPANLHTGVVVLIVADKPESVFLESRACGYEAFIVRAADIVPLKQLLLAIRLSKIPGAGSQFTDPSSFYLSR